MGVAQPIIIKKDWLWHLVAGKRGWKSNLQNLRRQLYVVLKMSINSFEYFCVQVSRERQLEAGRVKES